MKILFQNNSLTSTVQGSNQEGIAQKCVAFIATNT